MPRTDTAKVIKLASQASQFFARGQRANGDEFISLTDEAPEWLRDLVHDAHGNMLPDDERYAMIKSAIDAIAEADEDADLDDQAHEFADSEPSVFNTLRAKWLASHLERGGYVNEAVQEFGGLTRGGEFDIYDAIAQGWYMEAREVFGLVSKSLSDRADEDDSDEATE